MNRAHPNRWTLRFALLGGAVAWTLHLLGCYGLAEFGVLSGLVDKSWRDSTRCRGCCSAGAER